MIVAKREGDYVMKKRILILLLAMSAACLTACGSSESKDAKGEVVEETKKEEIKEELSEEEKQTQELKGWLEEGAEKLQANKVYGYKAVDQFKYEDGSEDSATSYLTIDTEKQIIMNKFIFETNTQLDFHVKEGDKEFEYIEEWNDEINKKEYVKKQVQAGDLRELYSERLKVPVFTFENTKQYEVVDYAITNAGEDDDAIKLKVNSKFKFIDVFDEMTRESVLKEFELSEEDLKRIDGASEALDAAIEENNKNIEKNKDKVYEREAYYWITKDSHELIKCEDQSVKIEKETTAENLFTNLRWKAADAKSMIEGGMSEKEAVKEVMSQEEMESFPDWTEGKFVTEYLAGDACEKIEDLPKDAKEVTE